MKGFDVHGIDVSHYQNNIDWNLVAADSIHFAFIKASEGMEMKDTRFATNWKSCGEAGIMRGAYHYYIPTVDPELQAKNFIASVELTNGDLLPVLDVEVTNNVTREQLLKGIRTWISTVEAHYNVLPIIYTNLNFYNEHLKGSFTDHIIWIARYSNRHPNIDTNWHFWQYSDNGRVKGIDGSVDLNVFNGTIEALNSLCVTDQKPQSIGAVNYPHTWMTE